MLARKTWGLFPMPALSTEDAIKLIARRHREWTEFQRHWRFLADSMEGGHRYKMADYTQRCDVPQTFVPAIGGNSLVSQNIANGFDVLTSIPNTVAFGRITDRNLVPHLSETDPSGQDIYALRLARTPIPKKLEMVVRRHLARIYAREVRRDGPQSLMDWWEDVDGTGTPIDKWMRKTVAPMLCVLGQLDICFDHPCIPEATIDNRADAKAAGLDRCVASYILPENVLWWRLDHRRRYQEVLILERHGDEIYFRHWTAEGSVLYDDKGEVAAMDGKPQINPHSFGCVPIFRVFDDRKPRCDNVGQSRYEVVADYQKCIYNALSEQILSDVQQADPLLQGPEDFLQGENSIKVGPDGVLPMKKRSNGDGYDGWSCVEFPPGQAAERAKHIEVYGDEINQNVALSKPAGASGAGPVAQSGVSKSFDDQTLNDYLAEVAATLEDAEAMAVEYVLIVLGDGSVKPADADSITITYPREFDLVSGDDLASNLTDMQGLAAGAGTMPETSKEYMKRKLRVDMPGLDDETRTVLEKEIESICDQRSDHWDQQSENPDITDNTLIGDDQRNQPQNTLTAQSQASD